MREQAEACGSALGITAAEPGPHEVLLHAGGNAIQELQALLLFGAGRAGGGASALRKAQLSLKTWQILVFPGVQNALGPAGRVHVGIVHTLVGLSAQSSHFLKK